ncbi:MAG: DedA family protein [Candidatus Paceibacterota bacterium]
MQEWLISLVSIHPYLVYGIIVLTACAEGPILSMIGGALVKLGYLHFWPLYAALMLGDLIGDVAWYYIGYHFGHRFIRRFGKYVNITEEGVAKVTRIFHDYKHRILFISKISNGFGFALVTLVTAGMVRIPFWFYMLVNLIGQFIWSGLLIGVGYFFSNLYVTVDSILGKISVVIGFIIVLVAFIQYNKYLKKQADKML